MKKQSNIICRVIATWFGSGLLPIAPGTWGSLAALPFVYIISVYSSAYTLLLAIVVLFLIGVWASDKVEKSAQEKDPRFIVVDEVTGQWIALLPLPFLYDMLDPDFSCFIIIPIAAISFFAFRIFDIWKPWPIRNVDQGVPGGLGIMLDDVIAGIYALAVTSAFSAVMLLLFS